MKTIKLIFFFTAGLLFCAAGAQAQTSKTNRSKKEIRISTRSSAPKSIAKRKKAWEKELKRMEKERKKSRKAFLKRTRKEARLKKKPQYSNPTYLGHKRKPKKHKPGKMKFCKECGMKH